MRSGFPAVFLTLLFTLLFSQSTARAEKARAELVTAQAMPAGIAVFSDTEGGVQLHIEVSGLTPGPHAMHLHTEGKCESPDFVSAGGHFNPAGKKHGHQNPEGAHAGDLENLEAAPDGRAEVDRLIPDVTVGAGPHSLLDESGTSLVIHAGPDDEKTDPSGNSGARVVCGVLQKN